QALDEAKQCALRIFGISGMLFWLGYIVAGDFIGLTVWRFLRTLALFPKIRTAFTTRNIYLQVNTTTGAVIGGPSLGLAVCIAIVMASSKLPNCRGRRFLAKFIPNLFGGLAGCAFTGKVNHGLIQPVDGIRPKLEALRDYGDLRRAFIPSENMSEV